MECYSLSARPFYNSVNQCYTKVLEIDRQPPNSALINKIIKQKTYHRLSPFDQYGICDKPKLCGYVVVNPNDPTQNSTIDDIPTIFTWLMQNGYVVNTAITDMMNGSSVKTSYPLLCIITRTG